MPYERCAPSRVRRVLLVCEAEHRELLAGDGVEHGGDDLVGESPLLVIVHLDHTLPAGTKTHERAHTNGRVSTVRQDRSSKRRQGAASERREQRAQGAASAGGSERREQRAQGAAEQWLQGARSGSATAGSGVACPRGLICVLVFTKWQPRSGGSGGRGR